MIEPDPQLTPVQKDQVAQLSDAEVREIDTAIEGAVTDEWRKLSHVVGTAMMSTALRIGGIPDSYYAERARLLIDAKRLYARGDPAYMQYCEVRSPDPR